MMEQNTNKDYLNKLLDFLKNRILPIPANHWFANDLYKILAPASDARISDIHEQCIESILQQQATEFYKGFVIDALRPQLISDFVKMEHWRRRDNVQEFCMALYQQIEAITTYLCADENLNLIWRSIRNAGFFTDLKANDIRVRGNGKPIGKSIIYKEDKYYRNGGKFNPELKEMVAMDKFKAILFMIVYRTNVNWNNKDHFNDDFFTGHSVYLVRNQNHRGNIVKYSNDKTDLIIENPVHSIFSILGFYARFISGINNNYPISKDIVEFAEICYRKDNT